ncbi:uncharacterized protein DS421_13g414940 [Arachis hypogaea]|nr:uncharacterized protein DS421_13g414940 [Arachis hypogaea]
MYRSLCRASRYDCKDMDGFLTLLLVWAWIWMPSIGPLPVDTSFPLAHSSNWITPHVIPLEINDVVNLWSAIVPLICFEAVELHPTNRVNMLTTINHPTNTWTSTLVNLVITYSALSMLSKQEQPPQQ